MDSFVQRFSGKIKGVISGFDRIVFKGCLRPLMFADGAMAFLRSRGVLNKDYKSWVTTQSETLVAKANEYALSTCGQGITFIPSLHERKELIAHNRQSKLGVTQGLIGVWSCIEGCSTYRAHYDAVAGYPQLRRISSCCKHLYFYYDHADFGFMSVRLQTWFPYGIQIALNGREWLRRALDKHKIPFVLHGNKFLHIADYASAQKLLSAQIDSIDSISIQENLIARMMTTLLNVYDNSSIADIITIAKHLRDIYVAKGDVYSKKHLKY